MQIIPIHTPLIRAGDTVAHLLRASADIHPGDIIVLSSKAVATAEGVAVDLSSLNISPQARDYSSASGRSAAFMEAVMQETKRLNGTIIGKCPGALLTELRPAGLTRGTLFAPNAGMDESNIDLGYAVGWPHDPVASARSIHTALGGTVGVIIGDSCCRPRRLGVTAFALTVAGMDPFKHEVGSHDLFGRTLRVTVEATADQLATAANAVMGNAHQQTPAAIIREHGIPLTGYTGWVDGIDRDDDLFRDVFVQ